MASRQPPADNSPTPDRKGGLLARLVAPTRIVLLPGIVISLIALVSVAAELVSFHWSWDIDHRMYFGERVLAGHLPWIVEFDDKLPVVEMLFALPAWAHSIRAWQLMSFLSALCGCAAVYNFLVAAIRDYFPDLCPRTAKIVAFYSAAMTGCCFAILHGGVSHINPMAASLAMVSITSVDVARRELVGSRARCCCAFLVGALSASVAIGLRPYFLYALVAAGAWAALKADWRVVAGEQSPCGPRWPLVVTWLVVWTVCIGVFGLLANVVPYVVIGRLDVLRAGLVLASQLDVPQGIITILGLQARTIVQSPGLAVLIFASWGVAIGGLALSLWRGGEWHARWKAILDIGYVVIFCPLLLEAAILTRHFWPHYLQLLAPFAGVGIGLFGAELLARGTLRLSSAQTRQLVLASLIVVAVSARQEVASALLALAHSSSCRHPQAAQLAAFERYLTTRPPTRRDFLNPTGIFFHWQLNEPRHGFPHAANTKHIVRWGWWTKLKVPKPFDLPTDRDAYCAMLEARGPSVVVELGRSELTDCLERNPQTAYSRVDRDSDPAAAGLLIFQRD